MKGSIASGYFSMAFGGEEIPFHVIGRKYTKGTNSRHGKSPYKKKRVTQFKNVLHYFI